METVRSLQDLGAAMGREKKFSKAPPDTVEPVQLRLLVEVAGSQTKAGELIGISGSHISACLGSNETRLTYELAAKAVLQGMERETSRPMFYFVEVRNGQKDVFDAFLRGMNLKATSL